MKKLLSLILRMDALIIAKLDELVDRMVDTKELNG